MRRLLLLLAFLVIALSLPGFSQSQTWSVVQWDTYVRTQCDDQNGGLPANYLYCSLPLSQNIGTGHALTLSIGTNNDGTLDNREFVAIWDCTSSCTVAQSCTTSNNSWTWYHGTPNTTGVGNGTAQNGSGEGVSTDVATAVLSVSGANCVTFERTNTGDLSTTNGSLLELSTNTGTPAVDTVGSGGIGGTNSSFSLVTATITGSNDAIADNVTSGPTLAASSSAYTTYVSVHEGWAYLLNTTATTAAPWTNGTSYPAAGSIVTWTAAPASNPGSSLNGVTMKGATAQ
jgi:hypothetical protein